MKLLEERIRKDGTVKAGNDIEFGCFESMIDVLYS